MIDGQKKEGTRVRLGDQQTKNFYQLIWPQEVVVAPICYILKHFILEH